MKAPKDLDKYREPRAVIEFLEMYIQELMKMPRGMVVKLSVKSRCWVPDWETKKKGSDS